MDLSNQIPPKKELIHLTKQFIKFGLVGISNTAISLAVYYIFVLINAKLYILGNIFGFIVSVLNSYYWNNKFVFEKKVYGHFKSIIKTYMAYGCTLLLSTLLLYIMVNKLEISEFIAPILNLIMTIPINFILNKFWVFN